MGWITNELRFSFVVESGHFYLLPKHVNELLGPNRPPVTQVTQDLSKGKSGFGLKQTAHLELVLRLRMSGALLPPPHMLV
jgi:hypothetical protein